MTNKEFMEKYGQVSVVFRSYYKYSFLFSGKVDGKDLIVEVGGNADNIYRFEVSPAPVLVKQLCPSYVTLDGETILNNLY